jgi:hypothetical protein
MATTTKPTWHMGRFTATATDDESLRLICPVETMVEPGEMMPALQDLTARLRRNGDAGERLQMVADIAEAGRALGVLNGERLPDAARRVVQQRDAARRERDTATATMFDDSREALGARHNESILDAARRVRGELDGARKQLEALRRDADRARDRLLSAEEMLRSIRHSLAEDLPF